MFDTWLHVEHELRIEAKGQTRRYGDRDAPVPMISSPADEHRQKKMRMVF
jgi:hypothetical protein